MTAGGRGRPTVESAERALFHSVGLAPTEHVVHLERLGCTVRVQECGSGPPVLFVHGVMTAGASWATLAAALGDLRCLLLDRPGCGPTSTLPADAPRSLPAQERFAADLVADVLDALDLESAHVVSTSLGGWFSFRSAAHHPARVRRIVGLAFQGGARIDRAPLFMRVQAPAWLAGRLPVSRRMVRGMLASAGMRGAIESGGFTDEMLTWMVALLGDTDTMRNEVRTAPRPIGLRGPIEAARLTPGQAQRIDAPVHLVWGTDDPFGGRESAEAFAALLPTATVEMVPGAGHAPWLDEPDLVARAVRTHLLG